ncbi:MAG TPA: LysR substrate-binding domain-containing protein [Burkholderiaceae bacterium]|jgi:LysR family glycine cleavage system transcriptional activator|nr:LysR substrate-binding domain-containing protein [Burkholderiaceae bacterium]
MARADTVSAKDVAAPAGGRRPARKRPIGLAALRGFESAARHLSFTHAAEELHLTQSAISRQVAALESDVGQRLFLRRTRALVLTPAGERLARSARQALSVVDRAVDEIRGRTASPRVVVTTYPSFASLWLVPRLATFQREHPGIEIRVDAQGRRVDLEAEGVDIALRRCPPQDAPAGAIALLDEDVTPALSAELLNRFGGRLQSPADLLRLPLIDMEDDFPADMSDSWPHWFEFAGVQSDGDASAPVMVVTYIDQSMLAAARGQGVVLARRPFREDMVAGGHLMTPFPEIRVPTGYGMYLIVNEASRGRAAVVELRDWLLKEFKRPPPRHS